MSETISSKYELCLKSIETEAVFTKTEMNYERNVDFLQNTLLVIQHNYSGEFCRHQDIITLLNKFLSCAYFI